MVGNVYGKEHGYNNENEYLLCDGDVGISCIVPLSLSLPFRRKKRGLEI
jgi:hypothetical protein